MRFMVTQKWDFSGAPTVKVGICYSKPGGFLSFLDARMRGNGRLICEILGESRRETRSKIAFSHPHPHPQSGNCEIFRPQMPGISRARFPGDILTVRTSDYCSHAACVWYIRVLPDICWMNVAMCYVAHAIVVQQHGHG